MCVCVCVCILYIDNYSHLMTKPASKGTNFFLGALFFPPSLQVDDMHTFLPHLINIEDDIYVYVYVKKGKIQNNE